VRSESDRHEKVEVMISLRLFHWVDGDRRFDGRAAHGAVSGWVSAGGIGWYCGMGRLGL
jgi:hypothetical protein